jgi:NADH-dependent peroxiredoxin subunit C
LAISTDSVNAHQVFKQFTPALASISFPLISDRTQEISKAYGVLNHHTGAAYRASIFISPEQLISAKFIYPDNIGRNLPEHLRLLQALQFSEQTGKGTPANWMPNQRI